MLRKIEIEEEVENTIEQHIREKQELAEKNNELKEALSAKDEEIERPRKLLEKK